MTHHRATELNERRAVSDFFLVFVEWQFPVPRKELGTEGKPGEAAFTYDDGTGVAVKAVTVRQRVTLWKAL